LLVCGTGAVFENPRLSKNKKKTKEKKKVAEMTVMPGQALPK
jgi:hypothetical protein